MVEPAGPQQQSAWAERCYIEPGTNSSVLELNNPPVLLPTFFLPTAVSQSPVECNHKPTRSLPELVDYQEIHHAGLHSPCLCGSPSGGNHICNGGLNQRTGLCVPSNTNQSCQIVAGIIGYYLQRWDEGYGDRLGDYLGRWIYSEVIAGLSILLGLLWLIPTAHTFFIWPSTIPSVSLIHLSVLNGVVDVVISFAWFAVFGLVVDALDDVPCGGVFDWDRGTINFDNFCGHWRAAEAFSFLSAIIWLVSGILVCLSSAPEHYGFG